MIRWRAVCSDGSRDGAGGRMGCDGTRIEAAKPSHPLTLLYRKRKTVARDTT